MRKSALAVVVASLLASAPVRGEAEAPPSSRTERADVARRAPQVSTYFEANRGQTAPQVDFVARCRGYVAFLTPGGATFSTSAGAFRMRFVGAPSTVHARGLESAAGRSNYFIGNHSSNWVTDVPHFARVACDEVLPGVDVVWRGDGRSVAYDVSLAPGVDPSVVRLRFEGADAVAVDERGDVVLTIPGGTAIMSAPRTYQDLATGRRDVASAFVVGADGDVSFKVGAHDPSKPLVVDPTLTVATSLGGADIKAVATDATGGLYVTGSAASLPATTGAFQTVGGGGDDAFVAKFASSAATLVYATYLGGSSSWEYGNGIVIDGSGNAFVCGTSYAADFPSVRAYPASGGLGFVAELSASGGALPWCTRLPGNGGTGGGPAIGLDAASAIYVANNNHVLKFASPGASPSWDVAPGISAATVVAMAVEPSGYVWIGGQTGTAGQASAGAFQTSFGGGSDGWIVQLATDGSPVQKTYFGGDGYDRILGLGIDADGNVYVAGDTRSTNLPTTQAFQATLAGPAGDKYDMFVARFNAGAPLTLAWCTYLGGPDHEAVRGLAVSACGEVVVAGSARAGFPTLNAVQSAYGGNNDGAFVRFASNGSVVQSSYFGGSSVDWAQTAAFDSQDRPFVVGAAPSPELPTPTSAYIVGLPASPSPFSDVTPATLPGATFGVAYSAQLTVGGGAAPFTWTAFTPQPRGLTLAPSGALTGAPTVVGDWSFIARVVDANGACGIRTFTMTVSPRPFGASFAWTIGRPCALPLAATGATAPLAWSRTSGTLPPGAAIDPAGFVSSPGLEHVGNYSFVVRLVDAWGFHLEGPVLMTVNAPPRITTPTPSDLTEFRPVDLKFDVADGTPPFAWSVVSGAAPVDTPIDAAFGRFAGSAAESGDYAFTVRVTDAAGAVAERAYAMHVNAAPFITTTELPWAAKDRPYAFDVKVKGGTPPYAWTVAEGAPIQRVAIEPATGLLVGTPTTAGRFECTVKCVDSKTAFHERTYDLVVVDALEHRGRGVDGAETFDFKQSPGQPVLRYVELLAGSELTIVVARRGWGAAPTFKLYDATQTPVDLAESASTTRRGFVVRKFRVPATGRYFVELTPDDAFKGRVALRVRASPQTRFSGTATFDASLAPVVVPFVAPPGAKFSARVAPAARSKARPTISSVTDAFASELLVPREGRQTRTGAMLAPKTPLVGGNCALTIVPRGGFTGDVVWTVTLRQTKRYSFALPDVATEGPGK